MHKYSEEDAKLLSNHVSNLDQPIYVVFNLPPEVVAVLFAYVSRSAASFRDNLLKLLKGKDLDVNTLVQAFEGQGLDYNSAKDKAKKFHEKWVVGYGHSSVAEHAYASVAIEDVSIIASKVIEDNRLASYTEKSTRYQQYDKTKYFKPKNIMNSKHAQIYVDTMDMLFDVYTELIPLFVQYVKRKFPKPEDMSERLYESISNARAFDIVRYILPAGTLTNLAMTANGRTFEYAITKFMSSEVEEMKEVGLMIKQEVKKVIPTLVKYADFNEYYNTVHDDMRKVIPEKIALLENRKRPPVVLVDYDEKAMDKIAAGILYRYTHKDYSAIMEQVKAMDEKEKEDIINNFLEKRGRHDQPLRELEYADYTFDILMDYGAFRDIQRHRMCTQTNQDVTVEQGYDIPEEMHELGTTAKYKDAMEKAAVAFRKIAVDFPKEAQYLVPLAYKKRTLFKFNLRALHHFIKLRSGKEGHVSYRQIACDCYDEIEKVHPFLAKYIKVYRLDGPARG